MILRIDPDAAEELQQIEDLSVNDYGIAVANDLRLTIAAALDEITESPQRYPKVMGSVRGKVLLPYPFTIWYEESGGVVRVYAFAHHRREAGYWKRRK